MTKWHEHPNKKVRDAYERVYNSGHLHGPRLEDVEALCEAVASGSPPSPTPDEMLDVLVDVSQLFDGWHQDGTAWSEWDESVRKRLAALNLRLDAARNGAASSGSTGAPSLDQPTPPDEFDVRLLALRENAQKAVTAAIADSVKRWADWATECTCADEDGGTCWYRLNEDERAERLALWLTETDVAKNALDDFVAALATAPLAQPTPAQNVKIGYWQDGKTVAWVQVHTPEATLTIGENALAKIVRMSAAAGSTGVPPTVLEAEMVKQASLGHTQFMVGVHEWMGEGDEVIQGQEEWIPWADAFAKLLAGRSPAEVPPNWPDEVQEARNVVIEQGGHALCRELSELESCDFVPLVDALCAAVWRSAQPHD
jgi:hypothetical protein